MYKKMKDEELDLVVGGLCSPISKEKFYSTKNPKKTELPKVDIGKNQIVSEKNVLA